MKYLAKISNENGGPGVEPPHLKQFALAQEPT
jgi:hypothetical protein